MPIVSVTIRKGSFEKSALLSRKRPKQSVISRRGFVGIRVAWVARLSRAWALDLRRRQLSDNGQGHSLRAPWMHPIKIHPKMFDACFVDGERIKLLQNSSSLRNYPANRDGYSHGRSNFPQKRTSAATSVAFATAISKPWYLSFTISTLMQREYVPIDCDLEPRP